MEALLPSEIARLVLGYLQEQNCEEVAKMFLKTSPHLKECRLVAHRGGRYSTKVGGFSLIDMLDKYSAANSIVQEKLNKVSDSEQIKNCNDITEQLRYLLEGSRGHRFVVNINVPTQNSPNGSFGTPTLNASSRKRQHSGSDRGKRAVKSLNNLLDSQTSIGQNCDTVETTPLESLPGHKPSIKQTRLENHTNNLINKLTSKIDSTQNIVKEKRSDEFTSVGTQSDLNIVKSTLKHQSTETVLTSNLVQAPSKFTEGTSTEQPMSYCSSEAQTAPLDLFDTEHDINYEPIANLSILTEELIHRTELAEQIAANINKSIIPIQENAHENSEANLSLLQGFDNAVKSAVETTDKVLEGLFNEIFTVADNDRNLVKDSDERYNQGMNDGFCHESMDVDDSHNGQQLKRPEVPLKQRLRSSSRSQNNEDERDCNALLENQNEEAIRSIVANVMASIQSTTVESVPQVISEKSDPNDVQQSEYIVSGEAPPTDNENIEPNKNANNTKPTKAKKNSRKPRTPKQKEAKLLVKAEEIKQQEQNIITMPTLILCSENDMQTNLHFKPSGYLPIAPKPLPPTEAISVQSSSADSKPPQIFLRTVHVPRHLVKPAQLEATAAAKKFMKQLQASPQKNIIATASCSGSPILVITDDKREQQRGGQQGAESITLYGDDSNSEVRVPAPVASLPVINLDESVCHLTTGTGHSPFFKGNINTEVTTQVNKEQPKTATKELSMESKAITCAYDEDNESEQQSQKNDEIEKRVEQTGIEKDKMINPTIVVTAPDGDETFSTEVERNTPEKAVVENIEKNTEEKVTDVNKEKPISEVKENKVIDTMISLGSEKTVNIKSIDVENEKIIDENINKTEEKSISLQKDPKLGEKSMPPKKDNKTEENPVLVKEDTVPEDQSVVAKKDNKLDEKPSNETKVKENARTAKAIITKRTPKSLLKDRSRNNRLSLSTPRRRHSHVRALDFDEKTPEHITIGRKVPQSCTRPKSSAVQGLFQSPPFSGETPPVTIAESIPKPKPMRSHVPVPPIATRSPAPKLQGNWNKVAGIGLILGDSEDSPEKSQTSPESPILSTIAEEKEPPKSWDSDLRKIVGEVNEDEEEKRPKSTKKCRRKNATKGETIEPVVQPKSAKKTQRGVSQEPLKITPPSASLMPKIGMLRKTSPDNARVRDFQTPCKFETMNAIPPTPRMTFNTPGACFIKVGSGKDITIKDCVSTPDFPPTPCIVNTPKIVEEEQHGRKPSPYYEPSEESTSKEIVSGEKIVVQQTTTIVRSHKKNVVELQESKTVEITKFGVIENMAQKESKEAEDNSKEITEEESMGETNASADTTNTDSGSDSDSDSDSSTSSSSNSSSSNSSSCSSNASSPMKSIDASHIDNSTTESEVDSPQKVVNSHEELERVAARSPEKEIPPPKVVVVTAPTIQQLTSTISAIITNEKPVANKSTAKPKIINIQRIAPSTGIISEQLTRAAKLSLQLEEKRQRVMAKFKQTAIPKKPLTVKRVTAVKKPTVVQNVNMVVKQEPVKKVKPSPKKKVSVVNNEEAKPKNVPENEKESLKAKVDQVKRDRFAPGDEADQRTTRSQSARKSFDENPPLPGVLECLQLIPANKSSDELLDQSVDGLSNSQANSLEVSFVYDDSVPIKKRKRNYSSSELENEYAFTFPDEDEVRIMKVQPYEEIFKMAPKAIKKKSPKKSPIKPKRKITKYPLAASSPIKKDKLQKKNTAKRKASPIKEEKQVEKKLKVEFKGSLDPQALFKKIDVDKFLKAVHVSR